MSVSMQSLLDLARLDLNDDAKVRYPDSDLIKDANDAIAKALVLRSDLNYGSYGTAFVDLTTAADFPLPLEYRSGIVSYIIARAQSSDDEFVNNKRVEQGLAEFIRSLGMGV